MNQNKNIQFNLNFGGFYDSEHSSQIDWQIEAFELDCDKIDFKQVYSEYANDWLNLLSNELELDLIYKGLDSPRFYNFRTDEITTEITQANFKALKDGYLTDECIEYINKESASRDGFTSFYNGIDAVSKEPSILASYIFNYILSAELIEIDFSEIEINL
jgi:hypothetical protein